MLVYIIETLWQLRRQTKEAFSVLKALKGNAERSKPNGNEETKARSTGMSACFEHRPTFQALVLRRPPLSLSRLSYWVRIALDMIVTSILRRFSQLSYIWRKGVLCSSQQWPTLRVTEWYLSSTGAGWRYFSYVSGFVFQCAPQRVSNADAYRLIASVQAPHPFFNNGLWQQKHPSTLLLIKSLGAYVHLSHDLWLVEMQIESKRELFLHVLTNNRSACVGPCAGRLKWIRHGSDPAAEDQHCVQCVHRLGAESSRRGQRRWG